MKSKKSTKMKSEKALRAEKKAKKNAVKIAEKKALKLADPKMIEAAKEKRRKHFEHMIAVANKMLVKASEGLAELNGPIVQEAK